MKAIFLDIDGVLALPRQYAMQRNKLWARDTMAANLKVPYLWDERCVLVLNRLLLLNDLEIVLSSDWRLHYTLEEIKKVFQINGVAKHPVSYTSTETPAHSSGLECDRVHQIEQWLENNPVTSWVAVDDMNLVALGERFVRTDERMGLGERSTAEKIQQLFC